MKRGWRLVRVLELMRKGKTRNDRDQVHLKGPEAVKDDPGSVMVRYPPALRYV